MRIVNHPRIVTLVLAAFAAGLLAVITGCGPEKTSGDNLSSSSSRQSLDGRAGDDLGQDWASSSSRGGGSGSGTTGAGSSSWAIVLGTFTDPQHTQSAANLLRFLEQVSPEMAQARVEPSLSGSVVVYGRYSGPDDPAAQRDLAWVKSLTIDGRPAFGQVMLSRMNAGDATAARSPNRLLSVRLRYPEIDPLYTLQIGVWGVFDGAMSWRDAQRRAEAQVQLLRAEGLQAYVHHDPDKQLSMVTVGLFDYRAIDPKSGLFSPEVEALMRRFPEHMVNGESIQEPISRRFPSRGTRTQKPSLVLVPKQ